MRIIDKVARIANRLDRLAGSTVNKLKDISLRGSEALPAIQREVKYRFKYMTYQMRFNLIRANTPKALEYAQRGIQIGAVRNIVMTDFWFIDDLREEMVDEPVHIVEIAKLTQFPTSTADFYSGIDPKRLEEADYGYPIYINEDMAIVDGNHRLLKAQYYGEKNIAVQYVGKPHLQIFNCDL